MTAVATFDFNPDQPRDDHGRWTGGGGGDSPATGAAKDLAASYRDGPGGRVGMGDITLSAKDVAALRVPGTTSAPFVDAKGNWTPERQALHDRIVTRALAGVPTVEHPTLYMTGGGPASGKTEMLKAGDIALPDQYVHIDPDELKQQLPEVAAMQAAGDKRWAAMSHEESSYLGHRILAASYETDRNTMLDTTGDSTIERLTGKIDAAHAAGFKVEANYITRDTDAAIAQAMSRGEKTGRVVPEDVIRSTHAAIADIVPQVAPLFDTFRLYGNNVPKGSPPILIATGGSGALNIHDQAAWDRFQNGGPLT